MVSDWEVAVDWGWAAEAGWGLAAAVGWVGAAVADLDRVAAAGWGSVEVDLVVATDSLRRYKC